MSRTPTAERIPSAMVLRYYAELTHSMWVDFSHRKRTRASLESMLRKMVRGGEIVGWRLMHIEKEVMGNQ